MIITYLWKKWEVSEEDSVAFFVCLLMLFMLAFVLLLSGYPNSFPVWITIVAGLILMELLFWSSPTDKLNKKEQKRTFGKTILLKLDCLFTVIIFLGLLGAIRLIIKHIDEVIKFILALLKLAEYMVGGAIVFGVIFLVLYFWIKLNERKFKK